MIIGDINNDVINNELAHINSILNCEKNLKKQLMIYMDKLSTAISNMVSPANLDDIHNCLDNIKVNLDKIDVSTKSFNSLLTLLDKMNENLVEEYNSLFEKAFSEFLEINNSVYTFTSSIEAYICINFPEEDNPKEQEIVAQKVKEEVVPKTNEVASEIPETITTSTLKENTLIISEKERKVILPFKISELAELKDKEGTESLEDIINKYFTVSLDLYKNSAVARFREAFNLVKHRERRFF